MRRKKRLQDRKALKRSRGACLFCGESRYETLQVHRVTPGCEGGKYTPGNTVVLCGNCHSLVTAGRIRVLSTHPSMLGPGRTVRWIDEEGNERWTAE